MRAHLLYRDRDIDWKWVLQAALEHEAVRTGHYYLRQRNGVFDRQRGLPWNEEPITADLGLETLLRSMARDDDCVSEASRKIILAGATEDLDTIFYRQAILRDCLNLPEVVRDLYAVVVEAVAKRKGDYLGTLAQYPDYVLRHAIEQLETLLTFLKKLREIADLHSLKFTAEGWTGFFAMLQRDLPDDYLNDVGDQLNELKFHHGELISAQLGKANKGGNYTLHRVPHHRWIWWDWLVGMFEERPACYSFELHPRDEAGGRALGLLQSRGIAIAADALGQAADHVRDFFLMLRVELAFYVGCINLHEALTQKGEPLCMPQPAPPEERQLSFHGLYDVGLSLSIDARVVGNDADGDGKDLVIITGPNTGGKSTFLRSVGLAQLMMQCGMFVPAERFRASLCQGLFTHFKREEDASMQSGKFEEELARMSGIIDHVSTRSMILLNESFASTNEREGSKVARQIMSSLLEEGVRILCVTHMYELAQGFYEQEQGKALFLRAQRQTTGARTFKLLPGEPQRTSFGEDLYKGIFDADTAASHCGEIKEKVGA